MFRLERFIVRLCLEPHMCKRYLCTFWDPKRLSRLSYKVLSIYDNPVSLLGSHNVHGYLVHICGSKHSLIMNLSSRNMSL